jgi:hypothetical protein
MRSLLGDEPDRLQENSRALRQAIVNNNLAARIEIQADSGWDGWNALMLTHNELQQYYGVLS